MGCGEFQDKTIFVVGNVPAELVCNLAKKDGYRVLHHLTTAGDIATSEGDKYKTIEEDLTDRYYFQAIFLQYDFPVIIVHESIDDSMLSTVALEQWDGEHDKRNYMIIGDDSFAKREFTGGNSSVTPLSKDAWFNEIEL